MHTLISKSVLNFSIDELKQHLYITHDLDDHYILSLAEVAADIIEDRLGIACRDITWEATFNYVPECLPYKPFTNIEPDTGEATIVNGKIVWSEQPTLPVKITYTQTKTVMNWTMKKAIANIAYCLYENRQDENKTIGGWSWLDRILDTLKTREVIYG